MNSQTEFIVGQLKFWPKVRGKVVAALAKRDLSNTQQRAWVSVFKRLTRMHRDCLHLAEWHGAVPSAKLAQLWREFVERDGRFCVELAEAIVIRLDDDALKTGQRCALISLLVRVVRLSRDFEAYRGEMFTIGLPPVAPPQHCGKGGATVVKMGCEPNARRVLRASAKRGAKLSPEGRHD